MTAGWILALLWASLTLALALACYAAHLNLTAGRPRPPWHDDEMAGIRRHHQTMNAIAPRTTRGRR